MIKLFPSQKDASKQMIQLPSKIHQFKASYFQGLLACGRRMTCAALLLRRRYPLAQRLQHTGLAAVTAPGKPRPLRTVRSSLLEAQNSVNVGSEVLLH